MTDLARLSNRRKIAAETGKRPKNISWGTIIAGERTRMPDAQCSETTQLLRAWAGGDRTALEQLTPRVYDELRRIAARFMQDERPENTIQATALVHEA